MVPSDRTGGNGHKLKHMKCHLNIKKNVITARVSEHWHRLSGDVVQPPPLETLRFHLDTVLGNWLWLTLLEQRDGPEVPASFSRSVAR